MQDIYSMLYAPYALAAWASAAFCGPALGPLFSGFAVMNENWRWSLWEMLWISGPVFLLMFCALPETSSSNILLRRAVRLRKLTGNQNLKSQSEIDQGNVKLGAVFWESIIKPWQISFLDPAVGFTHIYTSITYGIYYSYFEVFPLVYPPMYGFNLGEVGVAFTCIIVCCVLGVIVYCSYLKFYRIPSILKNGLPVQEDWLRPALFAVFLTPVGLFLFGWTARPSVHWIASIIGITIYGFSVFITLQCIFVYVPLSYPQYAASLFAANDFARSALASGAILFGRPLYINLGVGPGISLLGGLTILCIFGMFGLYFFGARLRARSKFALS
jgi:DHA1 family multidrug resistance protein-like MFS transporter